MTIYRLPKSESLSASVSTAAALTALTNLHPIPLVDVVVHELAVAVNVAIVVVLVAFHQGLGA